LILDEGVVVEIVTPGTAMWPACEV
jgi:hypothetical protein